MGGPRRHYTRLALRADAAGPSQSWPGKVSQPYVAQFEAGLSKNPTLPVLRRRARALGVEAGELLK